MIERGTVEAPFFISNPADPGAERLLPDIAPVALTMPVLSTVNKLLLDESLTKGDRLHRVVLDHQLLVFQVGDFRIGFCFGVVVFGYIS